MSREIPEDTKYFHYYNVNPKDRHVGDCVFRALSTFLDISWEDAVDIYSDCYLKTGLLLNQQEEGSILDYFKRRFSYEIYLEEYCDCELVPEKEYYEDTGKKRIIYQDETRTFFFRGITVYEFIDTYAKDDEVYLIRGEGHATVVKNRKVWDIHPCRLMPVARVYKHKA